MGVKKINLLDFFIFMRIDCNPIYVFPGSNSLKKQFGIFLNGGIMNEKNETILSTDAVVIYYVNGIPIG